MEDRPRNKNTRNQLDYLQNQIYGLGIAVALIGAQLENKTWERILEQIDIYALLKMRTYQAEGIDHIREFLERVSEVIKTTNEPGLQ